MIPVVDETCIEESSGSIIHSSPLSKDGETPIVEIMVPMTSIITKDISIMSTEIESFSSPVIGDQVHLEIESMPSTSKETICITPRSAKTPPRTLLQSVDVTRSGQLTPKAKALYIRARRLQRTVCRYRRRTLSMQKKLKLAKKYLHSADFSKTGQQLTRKYTAPKGRRFTLEEKLMSLALYKILGPGYRFLANWFNLTSKRTLTGLLQKIPVEDGISEYLMKNLKHSIKHFKVKERLCTLMFDEVVLTPFVQYSRFMDRLVGVQNGVNMDHALVFMVRGITKKWKQTVAYYFCKGTTSSQKLAEYLRCAIRELKKAGMPFPNRAISIK